MSTHVVKNPYRIDATFTGPDSSIVTVWTDNYDDAHTTGVAFAMMYARPRVTITSPSRVVIETL